MQGSVHYFCGDLFGKPAFSPYEGLGKHILIFTVKVADSDRHIKRDHGTYQIEYRHVHIRNYRELIQLIFGQSGEIAYPVVDFLAVVKDSYHLCEFKCCHVPYTE